LWADGDWCFPEELDDFKHKSDDYMEIAVDDNISDSELEAILTEKNKWPL